MANLNSAPSNARPESHLIEYLVIETKANGEFAHFESTDWQEAQCRALDICRRGGKVRLAPTIPLGFGEPVKGYVVGMNHEYPLSFHRHLPAANAAAMRYTEATGEDISYENAVAFVVPQNATACQEPPNVTADKIQQLPKR